LRARSYGTQKGKEKERTVLDETGTRVRTNRGKQVDVAASGRRKKFRGESGTKTAPRKVAGPRKEEKRRLPTKRYRKAKFGGD